MVFLHTNPVAVSVTLLPATAEELSRSSARGENVVQAEYCVEILW